MQEMISPVAALGIEMNHTTPLVMILALFFSLPWLCILYCIRWSCAHLKSAPAPVTSLWLQIITQNKLFHRLAFTLQGIIVNIQAVLWLQKGD